MEKYLHITFLQTWNETTVLPLNFPLRMQGTDILHPSLCAVFCWFWRCPKTEITSKVTKHVIWLHQFDKASFKLSLSYFTPSPVALYVPQLADTAWEGTAEIFSEHWKLHWSSIGVSISPQIKGVVCHFMKRFKELNIIFLTHMIHMFIMHKLRRILFHEQSKFLLGQCMLAMTLF